MSSPPKFTPPKFTPLGQSAANVPQFGTGSPPVVQYSPPKFGAAPTFTPLSPPSFGSSAASSSSAVPSFVPSSPRSSAASSYSPQFGAASSSSAAPSFVPQFGAASSSSSAVTPYSPQFGAASSSSVTTPQFGAAPVKFNPPSSESPASTSPSAQLPGNFERGKYRFDNENMNSDDPNRESKLLNVEKRKQLYARDQWLGTFVNSNYLFNLSKADPDNMSGTASDMIPNPRLPKIPYNVEAVRAEVAKYSPNGKYLVFDPAVIVSNEQGKFVINPSFEYVRAQNEDGYFVVMMSGDVKDEASIHRAPSGDYFLPGGVDSIFHRQIIDPAKVNPDPQSLNEDFVPVGIWIPVETYPDHSGQGDIFLVDTAPIAKDHGGKDLEKYINNNLAQFGLNIPMVKLLDNNIAINGDVFEVVLQFILYKIYYFPISAEQIPEFKLGGRETLATQITAASAQLGKI